MSKTTICTVLKQKVSMLESVTSKLATCIYLKIKQIDDLHISHSASGMGANIPVLLIRNSSSHSSLDVNGLELPWIAAKLCFTRLCNQR